jgi:hypothetical protein
VKRVGGRDDQHRGVRRCAPGFSTAGSAALPDTAATPLRRSARPARGFCSQRTWECHARRDARQCGADPP